MYIVFVLRVVSFKKKLSPFFIKLGHHILSSWHICSILWFWGIVMKVWEGWELTNNLHKQELH